MMYWLMLFLGAVLTGAGQFIVGPIIIAVAFHIRGRSALEQDGGAE